MHRSGLQASLAVAKHTKDEPLPNEAQVAKAKQMAALNEEGNHVSCKIVCIIA